MIILKNIFLLLFCVYYITSIFLVCINHKKVKKDKNIKDNSIENENLNNFNCLPLLSAFGWLIILIIATFIFKDGLAIILNLLILLVCSFAFLYFLKLNSFTKEYAASCYFDRLNGLSLFCVAIVIAVSFDMHVVILKLLNCLNTNDTKDLHDILIILFFLSSYFINIFFIFTLSSSFLYKIRDILQYIFDKVALDADIIKKIFQSASINEPDKDSFFKFIRFILILLFALFLNPIFILLYLLLHFIMLCLRFLIGLSHANNGLFLSFFTLISSILALIFSLVFFYRNTSFIYKDVNLQIFDFISTSILMPLIYDCINKYADKVKNNLISNK